MAEYTGLDRAVDRNTPGLYDLLLSLSGQGELRPDRTVNTPVPSTPTTTPLSKPSAVNARVTNEDEPTSVFIETTDATGKPITVFSTDGKLRTAGEFATAIDNYDNGQKPTPGFLTLPSNTFQGKMRTGFEESVGQFARETLPNAGGFVGSNVSLGSPTGEGKGRAIGQYIGEQFDTPGEAGMMLGTGAVSPYLKAPTSAAGSLLKIPLIANILKSGAAGWTGTTAARAMTGEELSPGQGIIDFTIPAVGGTMQGIVSHFLTKYLNKGLPEKVAKGIMDTFKERHPNMSFGDNILDIASSSQTELSNLTQQMSKGVRNSIETDTDDLLMAIKGTLPKALPPKESVSFQSTLRAGIRKVIKTQNEQLDVIDNPKLFEDASKRVESAISEVSETVRGFMYPTKQPRVGQPKPASVKMDASALRVEGILNAFNKQVRKYDESALVLHYMKQAGGAEGFDFNKFAQLIKGVYNENPSSQLSRVGEILGQGRPLTAMPTQQTPQSPSSGMRAAVDYMYNKLGPVGKALTLKDTGPSFPWQTRQAPLQPLINFGAQEGGQVPSQAVLRSFVNQGEQK